MGNVTENKDSMEQGLSRRGKECRDQIFAIKSTVEKILLHAVHETVYNFSGSKRQTTSQVSELDGTVLEG